MRRLSPVLLALASLAALSPGAASPAQDAATLRGELQARSQARDEARQQSGSLAQEIAKANAQLSELNAVEAAGEKGARDQRARLDALNVREALLRQDMGKSQTELGRLLAALELYRREPPPALLVTPGSAKDAVRATILIGAIEPELRQRAAVLKARAEELQRLRRSILAASEDLLTSESTLAEDRAALERQVREKTELQRRLDADAEDSGRRAAVLAGELRSLGASIRGPVTPEAGTSGPSAMASPVDGTLTRSFGQADRGGRPSDGLYWKTAPAALVKAPASGVVEFAGPLKDWGGVVIVNVGGGYRLVLAGLDRIAAPPGRQLARGQAVGAMGQSPSPELYLELRKDGAPVNPQRWLSHRP